MAEGCRPGSAGLIVNLFIEFGLIGQISAFCWSCLGDVSRFLLETYSKMLQKSIHNMHVVHGFPFSDFE